MSTRRLGNVRNREGRLDVLLYQLASRTMERVEQDHGVVGLCANLLPIVEEAILMHVPGGNLLPREIAALLRVIEANQGRLA